MKFQNVSSRTVTVKDGENMVTIQPSEIVELSDSFVSDSRLESEKEPKKKDKSVKSKDNFDLNNDGKVDKKDASIASKVMNRVRYEKKKKAKK